MSKQPSLPYYEMLAVFCAAYPGIPFISPHWGTNDDSAPYELFIQLYHQTGRIEARQKVTMFDAVAAGNLFTLEAKDAQSEAMKIRQKWFELGHDFTSNITST